MLKLLLGFITRVVAKLPVPTVPAREEMASLSEDKRVALAGRCLEYGLGDQVCHQFRTCLVLIGSMPKLAMLTITKSV